MAIPPIRTTDPVEPPVETTPDEPSSSTTTGLHSGFGMDSDFATGLPRSTENDTSIVGSFWRPLSDQNPVWSEEIAQVNRVVIPIEKLHERLVAYGDSKQRFDISDMQHLSFNLVFYSAWFPDETHEQFNLAYDIFRAQGIVPEIRSVELESQMYFSAEHLVGFFESFVADFNSEVFSKWGSDPGYTDTTDRYEYAIWVELIKQHLAKLGPEHSARVQQALATTADLVEQGKIKWGGDGTRKNTSRKEIKQGQERFYYSTQSLRLGGALGIEEIIASAALNSTGNPTLDQLIAIQESSILGRPDLNQESKERLWDFLLSNYSDLAAFRDYWETLFAFLGMHEEFIPRFLAAIDSFVRVPDINRAELDVIRKKSGKAIRLARVDDFEMFLTHLVKDKKIPEAQLHDVCRVILILQRERQYGKGTDAPPLPEIQDPLEVLASMFIRKSKFVIDGLYQIFFKAYAEKNGVEKTLKLIRRYHSNRDEAGNLESTEKMLKLFVDHDEAIAGDFLAGRDTLDDHDVKSSDRFWSIIFLIFAPKYYPGGLSFIRMGNQREQGVYRYFMAYLPQILTELGYEDLVKKYYFEHHPYSKIYALPEDLRPTGAGLSYASIDYYPDPNLVKHPDKTDIKTNWTADSWLAQDQSSHGYFVSTLAVGDTYGLASESRLHIIQFSGDEFSTRLAAAIHAAVELKAKDPTLAVVGMSLGLEIPVEFTSLIAASPIYQSIARDLTTLHDQGVIIAVAAGNDPREGLVNMIGLLPHLTTIGAVFSKGTESTDDDEISDYTTYRDGQNTIDFYAHADPVLTYNDRDSLIWASQGGTSSAQPHFAAAILVLKGINPKLTADHCLDIARKTTTEVKVPKVDEEWAKGQGLQEIDLAINPMMAIVVAAHLPGSTYKDKRLEDLTQQLIGMSSAEFKQTTTFLEAAKPFQIK